MLSLVLYLHFVIWIYDKISLAMHYINNFLESQE